MNKRALTWSQADSSRRGGNPRSPRTSISAQVPRGPLSASFSAPRVSLRTCRQGASPRGPTPLSLLPPRRWRRSAPCPSATPLSAAGPGKPSNGPLPPPRGPGGEGTPAPRPRGPRGGPRHARLPAGGGRRRRRQGAEASRRPATAPPPSPGRPMVRSAARTGASRSGSERARARAPRQGLQVLSAAVSLGVGLPVCGFFPRGRVRTLYEHFLETFAEPLQFSSEGKNRGNRKVFYPAWRPAGPATQAAFIVPHISQHNKRTEFQE